LARARNLEIKEEILGTTNMPKKKVLLFLYPKFMFFSRFACMNNLDNTPRARVNIIEPKKYPGNS